MMSVTSSATPAMVSNSWSASSKRAAVIAAPGIDDSSVRRRELPRVWAKPGSSGPMAKLLTIVGFLTESFDGGALHDEHQKASTRLLGLHVTGRPGLCRLSRLAAQDLTVRHVASNASRPVEPLTHSNHC